MAKDLPGRTAFLDRQAEPELTAGAEHYDEHVSDLVQEAHYLQAYYGRGHVSQCWPSGRVRDTTGGMVQVLGSFTITPRSAATGLAVRARVESDDAVNTGILRVACTESGTNVDIAVPVSGASPAYVTGNFFVGRADQECTIVVSLQSGAAGKYAGLLALSMVDSDLAVGGLP